PVTEMVTTVCTLTGSVVTSTWPATRPEEIRTSFPTCATAGLLLVTWNTWSVVAGAAILMMAEELPDPLIVAGLSVMEEGWPCGVSVNCDCALVPFQFAVIVARVFAATEFVGTATANVELPAGTVATAGGMAEGELLARLMAAPPAGASPLIVISAF